MGVLAHQQIWELLGGDEPLASGLADASAQVQANGLDMTLASVAAFTGAGRIGTANAERVLPETRELAFDADGWLRLEPGAYVVRLAEEVRLPGNVMAFGKPRSSLLRSGVAVHNAVWDAGYQGRSQALLVVYNPAGFSVARGARILQLVFLTLDAPTTAPYAGRYQGELLRT